MESEAIYAFTFVIIVARVPPLSSGVSVRQFSFFSPCLNFSFFYSGRFVFLFSALNSMQELFAGKRNSLRACQISSEYSWLESARFSRLPWIFDGVRPQRCAFQVEKMPPRWITWLSMYSSILTGIVKRPCFDPILVYFGQSWLHRLVKAANHLFIVVACLNQLLISNFHFRNHWSMTQSVTMISCHKSRRKLSFRTRSLFLDHYYHTSPRRVHSTLNLMNALTKLNRYVAWRNTCVGRRPPSSIPADT